MHYEPNPLTLFTICPTRKEYQHKKVSVKVRYFFAIPDCTVVCKHTAKIREKEAGVGSNVRRGCLRRDFNAHTRTLRRGCYLQFEAF